MYENYACSLHCMQDQKSHQNINSPTIVGQSLVLPHVGMLQQISSGRTCFLQIFTFRLSFLVKIALSLLHEVYKYIIQDEQTGS